MASAVSPIWLISTSRLYEFFFFKYAHTLTYTMYISTGFALFEESAQVPDGLLPGMEYTPPASQEVEVR